MNSMFAGRAALWMALLVPGLVFGQPPPAWFDGFRPTAQAALLQGPALGQGVLWSAGRC